MMEDRDMRRNGWQEEARRSPVTVDPTGKHPKPHTIHWQQTVQETNVPFCPGFRTGSTFDWRSLTKAGGICTNASEPRLLEGPQAASIVFTSEAIHVATDASTQLGMPSTPFWAQPPKDR